MALRTAIVVEGGAMRGIFAAGVLDAWHEAGGGDFDLAIGSSAGACCLASHLAGQYGRNRRCFLRQMRRVEFISKRRFLRGGHWLDMDWLWDAFAREDPLDAAAVAACPTTFLVAATSVARGEAVFLEPRADELHEALRASSAVPLLFRRFVDFGGEPLADGGLAAPIPVDEAYARGARRIVVVRSRPSRFAGPSWLECVIAAAVLRDAPALAGAFRRYREVYLRAQAFVTAPPAGCEVIEVAPDPPYRTTRTTRDARVLEADYARGRAAGAAALRRWRALDQLAPSAASASRTPG